MKKEIEKACEQYNPDYKNQSLKQIICSCNKMEIYYLNCKNVRGNWWNIKLKRNVSCA